MHPDSFHKKYGIIHCFGCADSLFLPLQHQAMVLRHHVEPETEVDYLREAPWSTASEDIHHLVLRPLPLFKILQERVDQVLYRSNTAPVS